MLTMGMLATATALLLGLRFRVNTLVLLTVAIVIIFVISILGWRKSARYCIANVGDACIGPNQLPYWLLARCTISHTRQDDLEPDTNSIFAQIFYRRGDALTIKK